MFSPIIPSSGLAGWNYVQRTYEAQVKLFSESSQQVRATEYFEKNIVNVTSAADLVSDRRLLEVALGAFGLQEDINNKFFVQKLLEEGSTNEDSLANRFSDSRYSAFVEAFGLGPGETNRVKQPQMSTEIISKYLASSFEVAAGQQDDTIRVALYAQRTLSDLASPAVKPPERLAAEAVAQAVTDFSSQIQDDAEYFSENIASITSAEQLFEDERLLKFALEAFGLGADFEEITSFEASPEAPENLAKTRMLEVFEEGSISNVARANQLENPSYKEISRAFGFGFAEDLKTNNSDFGDKILDQFVQSNFETPSSIEYNEPLVIVGGELILEPFKVNNMSNDAKWFTIMGEPPLRALFEKAFNLPSSFGQIDLDQQLSILKERSDNIFGSDEVSFFADPKVVDDLVEKYVVRSQIAAFNANTSSASIALALLQS